MFMMYSRAYCLDGLEAGPYCREKMAVVNSQRFIWNATATRLQMTRHGR